MKNYDNYYFIGVTATAPIVDINVFLDLYSAYRGVYIDSGIITIIFLGILFLIIGNFQPKLYNSEKNSFNRDQSVISPRIVRKINIFVGKCMMICGSLIILSALLLVSIVSYIAIPVLLLFNAIISYAYSHVIPVKSKNEEDHYGNS